MIMEKKAVIFQEINGRTLVQMEDVAALKKLAKEVDGLDGTMKNFGKNLSEIDKTLTELEDGTAPVEKVVISHLKQINANIQLLVKKFNADIDSATAESKKALAVVMIISGTLLFNNSIDPLFKSLGIVVSILGVVSL